MVPWHDSRPPPPVRCRLAFRTCSRARERASTAARRTPATMPRTASPWPPLLLWPWRRSQPSTLIRAAAASSAFPARAAGTCQVQCCPYHWYAAGSGTPASGPDALSLPHFMAECAAQPLDDSRWHQETVYEEFMQPKTGAINIGALLYRTCRLYHAMIKA